MTLRQAAQTARCPACRVRLQVPAGFRRGRCPGCGALLGAPRRERAAPNPAASRADVQRASASYLRFHAATPERIRQVELPDGAWWSLGHAYAVEYAPAARSARGNTIYRHLFGDTGDGSQPSTARLYTSPDGTRLLIVGNFQISPERGIVG